MSAEAATSPDEVKSGSNIVHLETFREIPEPDCPLGPVGAKIYNEHCRSLIRAGRLTIRTKEYVELLALSKEDIVDARKDGKRAPRQAVEGVRAALMKLEKEDADSPIQTGAGADNPFQRFGFAKRARHRNHS
ncbi:MAG: hypothetical protein AAF468_20135 [Pseudomonadota bacterium]